MQANEACPCCRAPLVEESIEDDDDSRDYSDEDEDGDDEDDENEDGPDVDVVTNAFITRGYDVKDAMSLLLCRYSKTDAKYTREYISKLNEEFDDIMEEIDAQSREQSDFAAEDKHKPTVEWAEEQRIHWHEDNTAVL
jgi:hypothetical protein